MPCPNLPEKPKASDSRAFRTQRPSHFQETKLTIFPAIIHLGPRKPSLDPPAPETSRRIIRTIPGDQHPELGAGEIAILDPETQEWQISQSELDTPRRRPVSQLYQEGGYTWMTAVTLCLVAVLFSAWKAPNWVKEFGRLAMLIGFLSMMVGFYSVSDLIQHTGYPISFTLLCGGLRVAFIAPLYGMIVYGISILVHLALKPRI